MPRVTRTTLMPPRQKVNERSAASDGVLFAGPPPLEDTLNRGEGSDFSIRPCEHDLCGVRFEAQIRTWRRTCIHLPRRSRQPNLKFINT